MRHKQWNIWIWCTTAEHPWAILPRESKSICPGEPADVKSAGNHLWAVWSFPIQGDEKPPYFKLLNRCNFQKLQLKSQLMTAICGFWLDFLVSKNDFLLELCTSPLGKKPKQTVKDTGEKTKALPRLQIFQAAPQCTESSQQHPIAWDSELLLYPEFCYIVYLSLKVDSEVLIPKWTGRLFKQG